MFETIIFFLTFYLLLISVIGYGLMFQSLCFAKIKDMNDQKVIFTGLWNIYNYFISLISSSVAHNFIHNILLHLLGFYFSYFECKKQKNFLKIIFIISFFVISALISKTHDDFSYYHLPSQNIWQNIKLFGLGNRTWIYFVSSIFFKSTFYLPLIEFFTFHFINIFFNFFNFFLFKEIFLKKIMKLLNFIFVCWFFLIYPLIDLQSLVLIKQVKF